MNFYTTESLNLPVIPSNLLIPLSDILTSGLEEVSLITPSGQVLDNTDYKVFKANEELTAWLKTIFDFPFVAEYIWQNKWMFKHRDLGRVTAYNYLLNPGGTDVVTEFYDNTQEDLVIDRTVFSVNKWYKLNVALPHMVAGDKDGNIGHRYLLSITPDSATFKY